MEKRGFTLIELLIVIAIAVIISGALVPLFSVTKQDAKRAKASSELDSIRTAAIMLNHDTGTWPTTGNTGVGLVTGTGIVDWAGPYLDAWTSDPWGPAYSIYTVGGTSLYIGTRGRDGTYGTSDDQKILITASYP